jgi:hypothetical protein
MMDLIKHKLAECPLDPGEISTQQFPRRFKKIHGQIHGTAHAAECLEKVIACQVAIPVQDLTLSTMFQDGGSTSRICKPQAVPVERTVSSVLTWIRTLWLPTHWQARAPPLRRQTWRAT